MQAVSPVPNVVEEVVAELEAEGARAAACVGSVADDAVARQLIECRLDSFGSIDVLINCASIARRRRRPVARRGLAQRIGQKLAVA